ncbi:unnamed protein product [Phytomonas sp. EM1]|nr:unnamed protein product [Phytomonas sp. EM1]|eukprot:CCW62295.1 unnamed protein product [Phytomonas sp. isolate EM1]
MHSRLPLSILFSAPGGRHAIPHRTFHAPADDAFFRYLDSNDSRLPQHPLLDAHAAPPEAYDTYTGEEVWDHPLTAAESTAKPPSNDPGKDASEEESEGLIANRVFDDVVSWVERVLGEAWAADGVVLCGRFVVANDCAWAVASRGAAVFTTREVFMAMRCSAKFRQDIHAQRHGNGAMGMEFTLAKALAGEGAKEMRVFLPYRLTSVEGGGELRLSLPLENYAAVCQRATDVCFPSLMSWTEREHDENFAVILKRLKQARLLERASAANDKWLSKLKHMFLKDAHNPLRPTAKKPAAPKRGEMQNLVLMLAVDILFEGPSLPIYLLSAQTRLFIAKPTSLASQEAERDRDAVGADLPYLKEPLSSDNDDDDSNTDVASFSSSYEYDRIYSMDHREVVLGFFRLIRDEANWNRYVDVMAGRYAFSFPPPRQSPNCNGIENGTAHRTPSIAEGSESVNHYCIIASDPSDLVTCRDDLRMRGLPLEFTNPDLLRSDPEQMAFLQKIRDGLLNRAGDS